MLLRQWCYKLAVITTSRGLDGNPLFQGEQNIRINSQKIFDAVYSPLQY